MFEETTPAAILKSTYKAPNPTLLQMQVLKAKPDDATYIEIREFRKYSKLDTTLFTFNKCFNFRFKFVTRFSFGNRFNLFNFFRFNKFNIDLFY